jgi:hypothetical protein
VAAGKDRTGQIIVLGHEEGVEGGDGSQAAVDGGRFETLLELLADESIYVLKSDVAWGMVANSLYKEAQITAIILPGMGVGTASAHPIDETVDLG